MTPAITLFLHRLTEPPGDDRTLEDCIPADDLLRARRFHRDGDRHRWLNGRAWIRRTLGSLLDRPPTAIAFSLGTHGKPRVLDTPPGFECNWSHSGDRIALAVSTSAPVGADLEILRDDFPALEVAHHCFTPAETSALRRTDSLTRQKLFFRLWTAKEALMKATGAGVSLPPDQIDVSLANSIPIRYATHPDWQFARFEAEQWAAAVAWPARVHGTVEAVVA